MERTPVQSSSIQSVGFEHGTMEVEFAGGRVYSFTASQSEYDAFMASESKGRFFNAHFRARAGN